MKNATMNFMSIIIEPKYESKRDWRLDYLESVESHRSTGAKILNS